MSAASFGESASSASERWATLEAIHQVENPRNLTRPGPFGELGAYQFTQDTWFVYTRVPFRQALDRAASDRVAVLHYERIRALLEKNHREVTPYTIALAWNGGLGAVLGHAPACALDYAQRVANLAEHYQRNQQVASSR